MKKTSYQVKYNTTTKTWCLFKYIQDDRSFNFYAIVESKDKKECEKKLKEIKGDGSNE